MKRICILTATRAEYGLLRGLIKKFNENNDIDTRVAVTGMHLESDFGYTYKEIEQDKIVIDKKIPIQMNGDSAQAVSKSMALAIVGFADYFDELKPDLVVLLGDRYETLAVGIAAVNASIPIAHLYGGETTEGALDECYRHSLTKMSYLHFTSTEKYRERVIQLGENPDRVFTVGALGVENILNLRLYSIEEVEKLLGISLKKPYALITFHPVSLESNSAEQQINELIKAIDKRKEINYIFTKANADINGRLINQIIDNYSKNSENVRAFSSLGSIGYLSALKYAQFVMGNSSSGLIEAPSFEIPTINIGNRQKGRIQAKSVINCEPVEDSILQAIDKAQDKSFRESTRNVINPYGKGDTSKKIVEIIYSYVNSDNIDLKKKFYDLGE